MVFMRELKLGLPMKMKMGMGMPLELYLNDDRGACFECIPGGKLIHECTLYIATYVYVYV